MQEIANVYHDGFGEKRCCLCVHESLPEYSANCSKAYGKMPDAKLEACGVARSA